MKPETLGRTKNRNVSTVNMACKLAAGKTQKNVQVIPGQGLKITGADR